MDKRSKVFSRMAEAILVGGAYKVTEFLSDKLTVKATRKRFRGKIYKRDKIAQIVFTVGAPNYEERKKINLAKKAGETMGTIYKYPREKK